MNGLLLNQDTPTRNRPVLEDAARHGGCSQAVLSITGDGAIQSANRAATSIFGYSMHELTALRIEALLPHFSGGGITGPGCQRSEGCRKNGQAFPVEIVFSAIEGRGGPPHVIALISELSVRDQVRTRAPRPALWAVPGGQEALLQALAGWAGKPQCFAILFTPRYLNVLAKRLGDGFARRLMLFSSGLISNRLLRATDSLYRWDEAVLVALLQRPDNTTNGMRVQREIEEFCELGSRHSNTVALFSLRALVLPLAGARTEEVVRNIELVAEGAAAQL